MELVSSSVAESRGLWIEWFGVVVEEGLELLICAVRAVL